MSICFTMSWHDLIKFKSRNIKFSLAYSVCLPLYVQIVEQLLIIKSWRSFHNAWLSVKYQSNGQVEKYNGIICNQFNWLWRIYNFKLNIVKSLVQHLQLSPNLAFPTKTNFTQIEPQSLKQIRLCSGFRRTCLLKSVRF